MKSLTEAQLKGLLERAWEEGGAYYDSNYTKGHPYSPSKQEIAEREELFKELIDGV